MAIVTVQTPDALSMTGNMKPYVFQTPDPVDFSLRVGSENIFTETYYPGNGNLVRIDVGEVVKGLLSFTFPGTNVWQQTSLVKTFSAYCNDVKQHEFRAIRSGVLNLNKSESAFLTENFLTWQPNDKPVTYESPEYLTYYAPLACAIKLKAYFEDGTNQQLTLASPTAGSCYTINLQYAVVSGLLAGKRPMYYDVWVENSAAERLTYIQRYRASVRQSDDENWYLFENSLGGLDSLRAYGSLKDEPEYTHNLATMGGVSEEYRVDCQRLYTRNTGMLTPSEALWLQDIFPSRRKYAQTAFGLYAIVFTSSDGKADSQTPPANYSFTYRYASELPLLNIQRRTDLPDNIVLPVPSGETFFLPPRLAEFPALRLNNNILFPVQDPHSEKFGTTSYAIIHDTVKNAILKEIEGVGMQPGGGGGGGGSSIEIIKSTDLTIETDENVYSAYRSKIEHEKKVVGDENKYIRKDKPDETNYRVDFHDGLTVGNYIGGFLGDGTILEPDGHIEGKSLSLREFLEVPELRFNRIDVVSGELWNAVAFGLIESVDEVNRIVTLKLEDGELSGMHLNDFCRGIFHNLTDNDTKPGVDSAGFEVMLGFRTSYFTPVKIIDNAHFQYELKPGTGVHPCQAMKFAVYGNPIDKSRQSSAYSTRTYSRYLRGVNTWKIEEKHISMQLGDLTNLIVNGERLDEGSVYLNNVYFGGNVWHVPGGDNNLKGDDAYSVVLSTYSAVYNVADGIYEQADVVSGADRVTTGASQVIATQFNISTLLQVTKGKEPLRFSEVIGAGKYVVSHSGTNCKYAIADGMIVVSEVTADKAEVNVEVNCEGIAVYDVVFTIVRVADGMDGTDYEYIYTRTSTPENPIAPATSQVDDFVPQGWTDNSVGPTLALPFEWVCKRIKENKIWKNYSNPSLWARFGEDGTDYEYIYTRTQSSAAPATPASAQSNDSVPRGWTDDPVGPTRSFPFEWVCMRTKVKSSWSAYSTPSLWSNFAEDGASHEYIYTRTQSYSTPSTPATSQQDDFVPRGWTDDPVGVSSTYIYEWVSHREKKGGQWGSFGTAALWAKYSFDGADGKPGTDGQPGTDGTSEWTVYRRSTSQPSTPSGSALPPSGWALDPPYGDSPLWGSKAVFYSNGSLSRYWSTPVKITGDPGAAGSTGPAISNRGEYSSVKQYYGGLDRVDVVFDSPYYYMAKTTAGTFQGQPPASDNKYWTRLQGQYESIAMGLAIIGQANIAGWNFKELYIESQNGNVVLDGNANDGPRIALGASYANRSAAPFRAYEDGSVYASKLELKNGCKIGGLNIGDGYIGMSSDSHNPSSGMSLCDRFVKFSEGGMLSIIGSDVAPSGYNPSVARFENTTYDPYGPSGMSYRNTAVYIRATSAWFNEAIRASGNVLLNGSVYEYNLQSFGPSASENALPIQKSTSFFLYSANYNTVYLPSRSAICEVLGLDYSAYCRIRISLTTSKWGVAEYQIFPSSGMVLHDKDGGEVPYIGLGKGVARDFVIEITDTIYAYIMS